MCKQIMVWTFMGKARFYEALRNYSDSIIQVGLISLQKMQDRDKGF